MMAADEHQTLLEDLGSENWLQVRDAVETAGDLLSSRPLDDELAEQIAERLFVLSGHAKWEVRKAVAHALLYLRHDRFHAAISRIIEDENSWVREAARKTLQRRTELTRADMHSEDHGDLVLGLLRELEARHGAHARKAAMRIAGQLHNNFVREAYHEIVKVISPLDAALANLETGLASPISDPARNLSHVRRARKRVVMLTDMLENLRDFTTNAPARFTSEDLLSVIRDAEEVALSCGSGDGDRLVIHHELETGLRIEANRSRLIQAFINIIVNAIEACTDTDRRAELTISAHGQSCAHAIITFADNGKGMGEEALKDCVQLYASGKPSGMGFGLPLAKKIIEIDHQGTLSIKSRQDKGTTVTVILPFEQLRLEG